MGFSIEREFHRFDCGLYHILRGSSALFNVSFEKTAYKTKTVKITLATNSVSGWNEIDAVQLVGE